MDNFFRVPQTYTKSINQQRKIAVIAVEDEDEKEITATIKCKYEVCSTCRGTGTTVNPSIDGNGISPEQFAEDPEFEEAYFAGRYDIVCPDCNGMRVELVPCQKQDDPNFEKVINLIREEMQSEREYEAEVEAERRMGA
jgi:hypothetical protein